jgi:membrane-anchored protein YejM (alkaline phosphatase superfamily)
VGAQLATTLAGRYLDIIWLYGQFGHKVDKLVLVITALLGFFVRSSVIVGFLRRIIFVIRVISRGHQGGGYFQMLEIG